MAMLRKRLRNKNKKEWWMYLLRTKIDSYATSKFIMSLTSRTNLRVLRLVPITLKKSHGTLDLILIPRPIITFWVIYLWMCTIMMLLRKDPSLWLKKVIKMIIRRRSAVRTETMISFQTSTCSSTMRKCLLMKTFWEKRLLKSTGLFVNTILLLVSCMMKKKKSNLWKKEMIKP